MKHDGPGIGVSPEIIKIDTRNGKGLLMDYDVNLNMKAELTMVRPSAPNCAKSCPVYANNVCFF